VTVLDLFSGIGGFSLAARWMGWHTIAFCEIEPFCQKVLSKNFPGVPIHDDVRKFSAKPLRGSIDILVGGYPCQPFSTAGQRRGTEDDRHLWPEVFRIVKECRPRWCLFENVAGHITLGLDSVLSDLENEGYTCQAVIIPACATCAPHRRDRVWIIAHSDDCGVSGIGRGQRFTLETAKHFNARIFDPNTSDSERMRKLQQKGRKQDEWRWPHNSNQAESDRRQTKSRFRRSDDGLSPELDFDRIWQIDPLCYGKVKDRAARLRALGNAIVPQVAYEIFRAIAVADGQIESEDRNND
jgi:DNA (cytosine-5)-methyltransferase 1